MSYELFVPLVYVRAPQVQLTSFWQERVATKNCNLLPTKPENIIKHSQNGHFDPCVSTRGDLLILLESSPRVATTQVKRYYPFSLSKLVIFVKKNLHIFFTNFDCQMFNGRYFTKLYKKSKVKKTKKGQYCPQQHLN